MQTYYIRHLSKLGVTDAMIHHLWNKETIAIHYPHNKDGSLGESDLESTNTNDYTGSAKSAMKALNELVRQGGYVFAQYRDHDHYKIGYVPPNSPIKLIEGEWSDKYPELEGRKAVMKGVKLSKIQVLSPVDAISLVCAQPRQGTFCRWWRVGRRVEDLVEQRDTLATLDSLTPDLQEVMCSEFLRSGIDNRLPRVVALLTPVGRTMKDVDIVGISANGERVVVQVTHGSLAKSRWKIDKMSAYAGSDVRRMVFCRDAEYQEIDGVTVYDLGEAYERYTSSEIGSEWITQIR